MGPSVLEVTTMIALVVGLLAASVQPSPYCPVAQGDCCNEVTFHLWTGTNPEEPQVVTANNVSDSHFNASNPTKMVIHGYASGMDLEQLVAIRREYLLLGPHNMIYPQYLSLVDSPCYLTAVINLDYVGKCIARFVRELDVPRKPAARAASRTTASSVDEDGSEVLDLHLIAFSLGAHTAAFAANHLKPNLLLDRISGLDPALPFFTTSDKSRKLSEDDAVFVDVLHTNAYMQGQAERCGHLDFYMNGGMTQPGCRIRAFWNWLKCDHHRAPTYFAESIRSATGFWGWACNSIEDYERSRCPASGPAVIAGAWADRGAEGSYVVQTLSSEPYARGAWWGGSTDGNGTTTTERACDEEPCIVAVR